MEGVSTLNGFTLAGNWVLSLGRTTASTGGTIRGTPALIAGEEVAAVFICIAGADFFTAGPGATTIELGAPAAGEKGFGAVVDAAVGEGVAVVGVKDATAGVEVGAVGVIEDIAVVEVAIVGVVTTTAGVGVAVVGVKVKDTGAEVAVVTERMGAGVATVREVRERARVALLRAAVVRL